MLYSHDDGDNNILCNGKNIKIYYMILIINIIAIVITMMII